MGIFNFFKRNSGSVVSQVADEIATRENMNLAQSWLSILPDPDPVLRKLGKDITVYKDLMSDDHVSSTITRRKSYVKLLEWQVQLPGGDPDSIEVQLCQLALKNLRKNDGRRKNKIKDIISQSLNPIFWGYSVFEIVWENTGGHWLPRNIEEKPREWFYFDSENRLRMKSKDTGEGTLLTDPEFKYRFIVLQNEPTYENPYGDKAISKCFWPVTFKRGGLKWFAVFIEKYGMPFITGKQPRNAGAEATKELLGKLDRMVGDAVAVIPDDSSVEIHENKTGSNAEAYKIFYDIQNNAISKAILTNVFSTENQKVGAYASSKSGTDSEASLSLSDRDFPQELMSEVFEAIIDLNIGSGIYPIFAPFEESDPRKEFAERDEKLFKAIKPTKKYITRIYNIPEDEYELLTQTPADTQPVQFSADPLLANVASDQDVIDSLIDNLSGNRANTANNQLLQPIIELLDKGVTNKDEITQAVVQLFGSMKTDQLTAILEKVIFLSEVWGRIKNQKSTSVD